MADKLYGYAGGDEVNGNGGNDRLDGWLGADTVNGGSGNDLDRRRRQAPIRRRRRSRRRLPLRRLGQGHDPWSAPATTPSAVPATTLIHLLDNTVRLRSTAAVSRATILASSSRRRPAVRWHPRSHLAGLSERITGIETLSMNDGKGNDSLVLSAQDVLDLGSGTFNPCPRQPRCLRRRRRRAHRRRQRRQRCRLSGNWTAIDPKNGPDDFDVFACHAPTGMATSTSSCRRTSRSRSRRTT